jgi:hypothetical protein
MLLYVGRWRRCAIGMLVEHCLKNICGFMVMANIIISVTHIAEITIHGTANAGTPIINT